MKKLFYAAIVVLFIVFGASAYRQNEKAQFYREEKNNAPRISKVEERSSIG